MEVMPFFPPHPNSKMKIKPESLDKVEATKDYVAQRKFNGTHVIIELCDGDMDIWNRHGEHLTLYKLTNEMKQAFLSLNIDPSKRYVLGGELLHSKAKSKITNSQAATNTIALFDIYMADKYLLGWSQVDRLKLLADVCGNPTQLEEPKKRGLVAKQVGDSQVWLAEVFPDDFSYHFYEMYERDKNGNDLFPEIEGLVLRMKTSRLPKMTPTPYDVDWMIRCRKTKDKIYMF